METLQGTESAITVKRSQVYLATHDGGGKILPYMNRSFISFTYGGKKIEDFDLIATISGDRLDRKGYADFNDTVTTYDNLDGQHYWATHYKTNQLDLTLSTDGIDQKLLDNFLHWFKPGISRELVLAEHPNRAIMARVSQPPTLNLLPFEQDIDIVISSNTYKTKTTLYKGDIKLSLVMDKPHWYALKNILGEKVTKDGHEYYEDTWTDLNTGEPVWVFASQDALKILYEDGIPLGSMIGNSMLLGNGAFANIDTQTERKIWSKSELADDFFNGVGARIHGTISNSTVDEPVVTWTLFYDEAESELNIEYSWDPSAHIDSETNEVDNSERPFTEDDIVTLAKEKWMEDENYNAYDYLWPNDTYLGMIAGAIVDAGENGIASLSKYNPSSALPQMGYFYYAGTAPAYTEISFTLQPEMLNYKIVTPCSKGITQLEYNTITIESVTAQTLRFTTPNVFTSYNKVITLFDSKITSGSNYSWEKLRKELRDNIRHPAVRAWAISVIEYAELLALAQGNNTGKVVYSFLTNIKKSMSYFLTIPSNETPTTIPTVDLCFNSETGLATGKFKYRKISQLPNLINDNGNYYWNLTDWGSAHDGEFSVIEEDVGDMLRSNYIIILDRNEPDEYGKVVSWKNTEVGRKYSHRIIHDVNTPLTNLSILYKNMYL